jgi:ADP-ribose pyrophosphatase YjhB (NUDIX family)
LPLKRTPSKRLRAGGRGQPKAVFTTPWFQILEVPARDQGPPHFSIQSPDFAAIVAVTQAGQLLLVRQFRVAVNATTLELPSGHVERGETPAEAARKELLEETGYEADTFSLLACLSPSSARFTNRMWCFFATNARPARGAEAQREPGMELVLYDQPLGALLHEPEFYSAGSCAALFAALVVGRLTLT